MYGKWMLVTIIVFIANIVLYTVAARFFHDRVASRRAGRFYGAVVLCGYILFVLWYTVLNRKSFENLSPLLVPFSSYWLVFYNADGSVAFSDYYFSQVVLNWLLLAPLGCLLPLVWPSVFVDCGSRHGLVRCVLVGFCLSLSTELAQLLLNRGFFEIDDIINNTLGCAAGYMLFRVMLAKRFEFSARHMVH